MMNGLSTNRAESRSLIDRLMVNQRFGRQVVRECARPLKESISTSFHVPTSLRPSAQVLNFQRAVLFGNSRERSFRGDCVQKNVHGMLAARKLVRVRCMLVVAQREL